MRTCFDPRRGRALSQIVLKQPTALFDAGIGSYAIARKIANRFSSQDCCFADRANFCCGGKNRREPLALMRGTIERLESYGPAAIVTPLVRVFPPIRRALATSVTKRITLLGVASLIAVPKSWATSNAKRKVSAKWSW